MKKFTLHLKPATKNQRQEITTIDGYKIVSNIFTKTAGSATITEAMGVYTYNDGTIAIGASAPV